jgi:5-methyltetrahydrofolate--homocysteine methyltransferase
MAQPILQSLYDSIVQGRRSAVKGQVQAALDAGLAPLTILDDSMIPAMQQVGRRFECGEYYIPELMIAARAMQDGIAVLQPHLVETHVRSVGKVLLGTVLGDLHDIGKNLVALMLQGAGFEVHDLGINLPPDKFVQAVRATAPDIVGLSALLTTTMPQLKLTIDALQAAGLRARVQVMVGGAPVTAEYAHLIGADGFAPDASRAVAVALSLCAHSPLDSGPVLHQRPG